MTHRNADRHAPRNPVDATIIRLLARRAMAAPRRHRPPGGHLTSSPGCMRGHGGGQGLVVGVDGAGDALADLRSCGDWALVSGSKTRRRTSWTWPGAAWATFAWPWAVRVARV